MTNSDSSLGGAASLASFVEREHATWQSPIVDTAIFGTSSARDIAARIDEFCSERLGSRIARARFYAVSVGCVAGVELEDGRSVVVKAQHGRRSRDYLEACFEIRRHLVREDFPCPAPLAGPVRMGAAWATAETLDERGAHGDASRAEDRRELASTLARLVELARPFATHPALSAAWFTSIPEGRVWPRPHSPLFDFEATAHGAAWIDEIAAEARSVRHEAAGERVVGHFDWRIEHVRFDEGRIVTSFDWDSLHAELEPVMVGANMHGFKADWQRADIVCVPTLDELRAFLADYETARGRAFDRSERATLTASLVYALAYTARCNHASSTIEEGGNGDFRPLLRAHGRALLRSGL